MARVGHYDDLRDKVDNMKKCGKTALQPIAPVRESARRRFAARMGSGECRTAAQVHPRKRRHRQNRRLLRHPHVDAYRRVADGERRAARDRCRSRSISWRSSDFGAVSWLPQALRRSPARESSGDRVAADFGAAPAIERYDAAETAPRCRRRLISRRPSMPSLVSIAPEGVTGAARVLICGARPLAPGASPSQRYACAGIRPSAAKA